MVKKIYRTLVPDNIKIFVKNRRQKKKSKSTILEMMNYYRNNPDEMDKYQLELEYIKKSKVISVFPYEFSNKYKKNKINVFYDKQKNLKYVYHKGERLYYPRNFSKYSIIENYRSLLMEQDIESPHRYMTENFKLDHESIFVDVGSAEGIVSLENIEVAKHIYLFEASSEWYEALEATFEKWKDKVTIINKFVSDENLGNKVTLDDVFKGCSDELFIKLDVEGSEEDVINGMGQIIESKKCKMAICTYHKESDAQKFKKLFLKLGFCVEFSGGYMLWDEDNNIRKPFFRKGLIRVW